ncbi:hypothetical protein H0H93_013898 [Arthromyces matolae]|nr:hypothetical protein H0H93_013898 [Arthromyces matolae]
MMTTFANHNDFRELAERCQNIGLVVWRATSGKNAIDAHLRDVLSDLKKSVDGIRDAVEAKSKKSLVSRAFNAAVDQGDLSQWNTELDRILNLFSTELSISTNLKVEELLSSFRNLQLNLTVGQDAPGKRTINVLPPPSRVFVGRDELVQSTAKLLLECRHVALIGPGGIGKSCIARAVLNDDAIATKFQEGRFFVRFDDMDASRITLGTFLDRIAEGLGLATSANTLNLITKTLSTSQTLLILDNAETFLDAAVDAGGIMDVIDRIGDRPNVAMLLTTRTTVLPPNLVWARFRVPALEESAACAAFKMYYTPHIENSTLVKVLSDLDFHPLSINLLAQAAVQSDWSPEDLIDAWNRQRGVLLERGDGKVQSIAVTIETSLNSPSVVKLGDTAYHLLQIIAFLPQGVSRGRLVDIFPAVENIQSCADALCKQSLAYLDQDFVTLLAPIRLYMTARFKDDLVQNPLLDDVRQYYAAHNEDEGIIRYDDINIEHVLSHWATDPNAMSDVLGLISNYIYSLIDFRPRSLSLRPIISGLDPTTAHFSPSCLAFLQSFPGSPRLQPSLEKAMCLFAISTITRWVGQIEEADDILAEARALLLGSGRLGRNHLFYVDWILGVLYIEQGNLARAEDLFQAASNRLSAMFWPNRRLKALIQFGISRIQIYKGVPSDSNTFITAIPYFSDVSGPAPAALCYYFAGLAEFFEGHTDAAKKYLELAKASISDDNTEVFSTILFTLAELADQQNDLPEARRLRAKAFELVQNIPDTTIVYVSEVTAVYSAYLAMEGNLEDARKLIAPVIAIALQQGHIFRSKYLAGMIELIAGEFDKAQEYFEDTIEDCIFLEEFRVHAYSKRALGEIAIIKGDSPAANKYFDATVELCETAGLPKDCLYRDLSCYMPNETFDGWKLYLEARVQA